MDTNGTGPNFDYSCEITSNYFKSSFARSMAFSNSNQSKSLDYVYFDRATINEECEPDNQKLTADDSSVGIKAFSPQPPRSYGSPTSINNHQIFTSPDFGKINGRNGNKTNDALKLWNMKKETLKREEESKENNHFHHQNNHQPIEDNNCTELIRLRKECQSLMEENRRLQQLDHKRPSPAHSPTTSHIDISYLQSQVDTLQWQLKQAESSRQMYRAVLEQVSRFLERVHKNLDQANGVKPCNSKAKSTRVPRSRSVHTVATTSSSCSSSHSRPSSPSPSPSPSYHVHRASSIAQMQESHSYATLRDHWRSPRNSVVEDVPVDKLAQEAFRMLRTVQSLLGTREPDLMGAHRLTPTPTPTPTPAMSVSETTLNDSGSERRDSTSVGSCSSLLQSSCGGLRKSLDCASSINSLGSCSRTTVAKLAGDVDDVDAVVHGGGGGKTASSSTSSSPPLHLISSTEDESGFSSMSSFHEVGLPDCGAGGRGGGYPELGLPLVEPPNHRRWSSTPVDTHFHTGEAIRVLWV